MAETLRLDVALVERGLVKSRTRAKLLVEKGQVLVNGKICNKSSFAVTVNDILQVEDTCRFVSRGGYKLLKGLEVFGISVEDLACVDVGASTGGFTDCLLQHGATLVYAVDVGTNQLVDTLRNHPKVVCKEQFNFRYATKEDFPTPLQFACVDVSFISLSMILPALATVLEENAQAVCLIKPQFEAGRENIGKNGIVKSKKAHLQVLKTVTAQMNINGFSVMGITGSPIQGGNGNIEYLAYLKKDGLGLCPLDEQLQQVVEKAPKEVQEERV